eukprot:GHVU01157648.1.p1 GENE.GHVU01157648.1~~GHVU01157648.1.p1  ORF type:complete len:198 (-),score=16.51 GHVU01157648.1:88-681(-)
MPQLISSNTFEGEEAGRQGVVAACRWRTEGGRAKHHVATGHSLRNRALSNTNWRQNDAKRLSIAQNRTEKARRLAAAGGQGSSKIESPKCKEQIAAQQNKLTDASNCRGTAAASFSPPSRLPFATGFLVAFLRIFITSHIIFRSSGSLHPSTLPHPSVSRLLQRTPTKTASYSQPDRWQSMNERCCSSKLNDDVQLR